MPPCGCRSTPDLIRGEKDEGSCILEPIPSYLQRLRPYRAQAPSLSLQFQDTAGRQCPALEVIFLERVDAGLQLFVEDEVLLCFTRTCAKRRDLKIRKASGRPRCPGQSACICALQDLEWSGFADLGREGVNWPSSCKSCHPICFQLLPRRAACCHFGCAGTGQQSCKARQHRTGVRW